MNSRVFVKQRAKTRHKRSLRYASRQRIDNKERKQLKKQRAPKTANLQKSPFKRGMLQYFCQTTVKLSRQYKKERVQKTENLQKRRVLQKQRTKIRDQRFNTVRLTRTLHKSGQTTANESIFKWQQRLSSEP